MAHGTMLYRISVVIFHISEFLEVANNRNNRSMLRVSKHGTDEPMCGLLGQTPCKTLMYV